MTILELDWMKNLVSSLKALVPVANVLTELGGEIILFVLIAFVYFAIDKDKGERIAYGVLLSSSINGIVKSVIRRPRPFTYDPTLSSEKLMTEYATSYSCPSGHAQNAGVIYTSLFMYFKKWWVRLLCVLAAVIVPFTRVLLGVHFPSDVAFGTLLGVGIAIAAYFLTQKFWDKRELVYIITAATTLVVLLAVYLPISFFEAVDADTIKALGALSGLCVGLIITNKYVAYQNTRVWWKMILRFLLAVAVMSALKFGLKPLFALIADYFILDYVRYFLTIGITIGLVPYLTVKLKLQ